MQVVSYYRHKLNSQVLILGCKEVYYIIDSNPSIYFPPRFIYILMMTQVESKRLNYGIVFWNSLMEFKYGKVVRNSLESK